MDRFECLACGPVESRDPFSPFCPGCGEPLFAAAAGPPGRRRFRLDRSLALERFADFLPLEGIDPGLSLGEGSTPLLPLARVGADLGLPAVWAKNEAQNPTASFKDRGTAVAVQKAVALGLGRIGTVSTGNMAASTAAYGARAGLPTFVLLKEGTSEASLRAAAAFRPRLVAVAGDYGALFRASLEIGRRLGIAFLNSIDPFRLEGYKLTAFEIFLQLGGRAPRSLVAPVSSGGHFLGLLRGFDDLEREGMIKAYPLVVGVQAEGCAPLVRAFESGRPRFERIAEVRTIAHAIANPDPPAGNAVLRLVRERGGLLLAVPDADMLEAQARLAGAEGLFVQPESAAALAALERLARSGRIGGDGDDVLVLTGSGLKSAGTSAAGPAGVRASRLDRLEADLAELL